MDFFLQNVVNALQWGSFYALIALGYSMVYGVLLLFNFAHGDIFMVGSYIGFFIATALLALLAYFGTIALPGWVVLIIVIFLAMFFTSFVGSYVFYLFCRYGSRKDRLSTIEKRPARLRSDHWINDRHHFGDIQLGVSGHPPACLPHADRNNHIPNWWRVHYQ